MVKELTFAALVSVRMPAVGAAKTATSAEPGTPLDQPVARFQFPEATFVHAVFTAFAEAAKSAKQAATGKRDLFMVLPPGGCR
jgi:hypothetical protein